MFRFRPSRHWKQLYFTSTIASIIPLANPLFSISWKLSRSFFFPSSAFGCLQREFYILNFRILWFIQTDFNQYVSSPPETVLDCVINTNFWYLYFLDPVVLHLFFSTFERKFLCLTTSFFILHSSCCSTFLRNSSFFKT